MIARSGTHRRCETIAMIANPIMRKTKGASFGGPRDHNWPDLIEPIVLPDAQRDDGEVRPDSA